MTEQQIAQLFMDGFDCGQVTFASVAEELGLNKDEALRLAAGFGGGMFAGETCGAVVGALMALGYKYGHCKADDQQAKETITAKVGAFRANFCQKYGSTMCCELLGHKIPDEMSAILEKKLLIERCPKITATAIKLLKEQL